MPDAGCRMPDARCGMLKKQIINDKIQITNTKIQINQTWDFRRGVLHKLSESTNTKPLRFSKPERFSICHFTFHIFATLCLCAFVVFSVCHLPFHALAGCRMLETRGWRLDAGYRMLKKQIINDKIQITNTKIQINQTWDFRRGVLHKLSESTNTKPLRFSKPERFSICHFTFHIFATLCLCAFVVFSVCHLPFHALAGCRIRKYQNTKIQNTNKSQILKINVQICYFRISYIASE